MKHTRKIKFSLLPYIHVVKIENGLSKEAKKSFDCDWDSYYTMEFGWLFFHNIING